MDLDVRPMETLNVLILKIVTSKNHEIKYLRMRVESRPDRDQAYRKCPVDIFSEGASRRAGYIRSCVGSLNAASGLEIDQ